MRGYTSFSIYWSVSIATRYNIVDKKSCITSFFSQIWQTCDYMSFAKSSHAPTMSKCICMVAFLLILAPSASGGRLRLLLVDSGAIISLEKNPIQDFDVFSNEDARNSHRSLVGGFDVSMSMHIPMSLDYGYSPSTTAPFFDSSMSMSMDYALFHSPSSAMPSFPRSSPTTQRRQPRIPTAPSISSAPQPASSQSSPVVNPTLTLPTSSTIQAESKLETPHTDTKKVSFRTALAGIFVVVGAVLLVVVAAFTNRSQVLNHTVKHNGWSRMQNPSRGSEF